jgi:BlaI family transcriptional regulator, penicillinase repressor
MNIVFRSKKKGLNRLFGELESEVMNLLWKKGPLRGKELHEALRKRKKTAVTTVLTVLDRLSKKGFVKKNRDSGLTIFSPAVTREEFETRVTSELIKSAYEMCPDCAISAFTDIFSKMKSDELDKLAKLVEEKQNESHGQN